MINSNVMRVVGEALESHHIKQRTGERLADTVSRGLHISDTEAEQWLEALDQGATLEEANRRAGVTVRVENEPVLNSIARSIGSLAAGVSRAGMKTQG